MVERERTSFSEMLANLPSQHSWTRHTDKTVGVGRGIRASNLAMAGFECSDLLKLTWQVQLAPRQVVARRRCGGTSESSTVRRQFGKMRHG